MVAFATPVDICNRALQHVGAEMLNPTLGFVDGSRGSRQCSFVYDKLRRAELRRNTWRFAIRRTLLRPIEASTMFLMPSLFQGGATYFVGSIVSDQTNTLWESRSPSNLGNDPQNSLTWEQYFGPLTVHAYDSETTYSAGELVYTETGDGGARVYRSLVDSNDDNPATATEWDATVTYRQNQVVTRLSVPYMSLTDLNTNHQPPNATHWATSFVGGAGSIKWLQIGGPEFPAGVGVSPISIVYPVAAGASSTSIIRNVYRLPSNYLRTAPQEPKAGSTSHLGAPTSLPYTDWNFENDFILTRERGSIAFRFVGDVGDVPRMDDMFCEGLAVRIALAVCEPLTQSSSKLATLSQIYKEVMGDARTVNGIEIGAEESPEDDFITCRL